MKNVRFHRNGIEFEPTKQELKIVLDDYAKQLGEKDKRIAELENQLKNFLEKWEWLDLEDADKTLTESEQKIWEIMQKNQDLEKQVAEKEKKFQKWISSYFASPTNQPVLTTSQHITQDKIDFAIDILEELADCSNYINSKLDFECGFYVSEKTIRDKIKHLKGNENE